MSQELSTGINPILTRHKGDIQFYGIKRSGNHAIIYWILGHYEEYIHYNNCVVHKRGNIHYRETEGVFKSRTQKRPRFLVSFEDSLDKNSSNIEFLGNHLPRGKIRIMTIRDPFNTFASRIKNYSDERWKAIKNYANPEIWKEAAREYLGITNYLNFNVKINYNSWVSDIDYRKTISSNFGQFTDKNFNNVSPIGGGSSFDKLTYDGKSNEMKLLNRWEEMRDNEEFKGILQDKELVELSNIIFGNILSP